MFQLGTTRDIKLWSYDDVRSGVHLAVNLFIIISGYFMCKTNTRNIMKIIELVCLMLVIREAVCIIQSMYNGGINIRELIVNLIPNDYFIILYCVLFLISPYINRLLDLLDEKELNRLVFRLVVIFGIWNVLVQLLNEFTGREWLGLSTVGYEGSERGFTIVNFIVMYIVGSWIRRNHIDEKINIKQIIIGLIFIYLCLFGWSLGNDYFSQFGIRSAWCYYNPLVQAEAVLVFCLFRKIKFKSKSINYIAGSAFTCYLIHTNILHAMKVEQYVMGSFVKMMAVYIAAILISLAVGVAVWTVWVFLTGKMFRFLGEKTKNMWN